MLTLKSWITCSKARNFKLTNKNTTNRLGELKEAQSKVEEQFKNGDIGEQQYREFQREVISTEKELANLSQQQTELEKATDDTADEIDNLNKSTKDAGEAAEDSSSKFEGLGSILKGIGVAVGTAVAAVGVATVKLGKDLVQLGDDYNSAVNDIGVKTGTTGKELEGLGDIAKMFIPIISVIVSKMLQKDYLLLSKILA